MFLLYNGLLMPEEELRLPLTNRAFQYNDGFFETIMVVKGRLRFWQDHVARMREAAFALRLELPSIFFSVEFEEQLLELARTFGALTNGRLKLKVWRAGAGLYTPQTNEVVWLAMAQAATPVPEKSIQVGVCHGITTLFSPLSHFKGPNAPLYVLAGVEKQERGVDDLVLLNRQQIVAELISSNLFWIRDNVLYTPAMDTGCVNGILRRNILRHCQVAGIKVREAYFPVDKVQQADAAFAANVTGLRPISSIEGIAMPTNHPLTSQLQDTLL